MKLSPPVGEPQKFNGLELDHQKWKSRIKLIIQINRSLGKLGQVSILVFLHSESYVRTLLSGLISLYFCGGLFIHKAPTYLVSGFFWQNSDPGLCTSNAGRKFHWKNILHNSKRLLFCPHTFGVRHTIDVLNLENQPGSDRIRGSRAYRGRLTPKVWKQKRRFEILSKIFIQWTLKNLPSFEVQSPGSGFWPDPDPHSWLKQLNRGTLYLIQPGTVVRVVNS